MKLYSCKIYENDELVRDFIPCLTLNYEVGLFDQVNKVFYPNIGTGIFNAGAEEELIEPQLYHNIARKTNAGYVGVDGVARLFFEGPAKFIAYTGNYTESEVEIDGKAHTLYKLTSSGTLMIEGSGARVWMCGGGAGGNNGQEGAAGGGGGYVAEGVLGSGEHAVIIGAGGRLGYSSDVAGNGGQTSVSGISADGGKAGTRYGAGGDGGSGGGGGEGDEDKNGSSGGKGAGVSTYPFGLTELLAHSAGGGGGWLLDDKEIYTYSSGDGGSNGSDGGASFYESHPSPGDGGEYGGGDGSGSTAGPGDSGTFYGAGGGGGTIWRRSSYYDETNGGSGYQGVVYIAILV